MPLYLNRYILILIAINGKTISQSDVIEGTRTFHLHTGGIHLLFSFPDILIETPSDLFNQFFGFHIMTERTIVFMCRIIMFFLKGFRRCIRG